jgi:outer membrane protein assembly factor BamB
MFGLLLGVVPCVTLAANWPNWRGPHRDGTADARNLPETWTTEKNIKWKQEMPAWSGSSPMIWGDRVFLNSPSKDAPTPAAEPAPGAGGRRPAPGLSRGLAMNSPGGQELLLLCLDRATGKEIWRRQYDQGNSIQMKQNMSSPTPVTDGKLIWVVSGNGVIACFDFNGNEKWKFNIVEKFGRIGLNYGYGSSPLLLDGQLIVQVLHGMKTDDPSYIFSLNATTGALKWRVERPTDAISESPDAYTTPAVVEVGGKKEIVISGGGYLTGHSPDTGAELWRSGGLIPNQNRNYRVISSPVVRDGMIFAPTRQTPLLAVRPGGKGDISKSHVAWSWTGRAAPDVPTPVSDGARFYMADDAGMFSCLDAKTGALIYGPHDLGIGRVSSSPILADGKIYLISETAETAVIQAGPEYKLLATNSLDGSYTLSTPAFVDNEIYIRTGTHLYCIRKS